MKGLRAKILINAAARGSFDEMLRRRLSEIFTDAGATADIAIASTPDEVRKIAETAATDNWDLGVAGGGDGTVNLVASALIGTRKHLGVLPRGTRNHFVKDLSTPLDLESPSQNAL